MKLYICFDIDGTLTHRQIMQAKDTKIDNIKGGERVGELLNRAIEEGHYIAITSFNENKDLIKKMLINAGVTEQNLEKIAIVNFTPANRKVTGKNLHCQQAAEIHNIDPTEQPSLLFDDSDSNCDLFKESGGTPILVNGDSSYLDLFKQILDNPFQAINLAQEYHAAASNKRITNQAFTR